MTAPCSVSLASSSTFGKVWRRIVGNTYQESDPLVGCAGISSAFFKLEMLLYACGMECLLHGIVNCSVVLF